jgi:hypothetical protein
MSALWKANRGALSSIASEVLHGKRKSGSRWTSPGPDAVVGG